MVLRGVAIDMAAARKWSADIRVFANISAVIKEQTIVHVETRYFLKNVFLSIWKVTTNFYKNIFISY